MLHIKKKTLTTPNGTATHSELTDTFTTKINILRAASG